MVHYRLRLYQNKVRCFCGPIQVIGSGARLQQGRGHPIQRVRTSIAPKVACKLHAATGALADFSQLRRVVAVLDLALTRRRHLFIVRDLNTDQYSGQNKQKNGKGTVIYEHE